MEVIATKQGFFGCLREVGDKFQVPDGAKSSWFESVETGEAKVKRGRKPKDESPSSFSEQNKADAEAEKKQLDSRSNNPSDQEVI